MQLFPLILFGIATAFSPGPNNIMTSYTAFNFGFRKAIPTMLGVIIGWTLLIIILQLTSGAIFQTSHEVAVECLDGFEKDKQFIIPGKGNRRTALITKLLPRTKVLNTVGNLFKKIAG